MRLQQKKKKVLYFKFYQIRTNPKVPLLSSKKPQEQQQKKPKKFCFSRTEVCGSLLLWCFLYEIELFHTDILENHFVSMFSLHMHLIFYGCKCCYSLLMASQFYRKFDKIRILSHLGKLKCLGD